jgi:hypothetical protein
MPQELIQLNVRRPIVRVVLVLLLLLAATWSYFVVRWYVGNTLAEYFNPDQNNLRVAQMATSFAPKDPLTHWRIAQVSQKLLPLDQQAQAIVEYEQAVKLSPNDYRFWMALGTAYEQAGESASGEQALKRAVALAPSYAYPHWYLGNLLLRSGRYEEAFNELRIASEADSELQPQQFSLIWAIYSNDPEGLKNAIGNSQLARASFALYLLGQQRYDDGLRLWNSLPAEDKKANHETGESIVRNLINAHRYHDAVNVWNEIVPNERYHAQVGQIFDGGFEEAISSGPEMIFGWQVKGAPQLQIGLDPTKRNNGLRSLRLVFQVRTNLDTVNVLQLVPVQPNSEYEFECYVSTEKLQSGSLPLVQILDASGGAVLGSSPQAPNGSSPWSRVAFSFKTGAKTEAVSLKVVRTTCSNDETPVCPIFGSVWYDDFSFKRRN